MPSAYWLSKHLVTIKWKDGSLVYCRRCDSEVAMKATETPKGAMLECEQGHHTHPANVVVWKGNE